ncbi:quinolinate synthase NadA [Salinimicrobium sp. MT39]|uniref:Quinolinate synthase n=1 Tax=Salinimicrobium profundisediminis TaxID=2994553 RepID=A0A9X3I227_9FLAO|nr:quinolinate synthase NadA [Salinimicrobium profundisediminis]MCX2839194.1 quinolinate synthase NadA [Salinimicrobium profundisediminis]
MTVSAPQPTTLQEELAQLKKDKNAVILAHYYQEPEIQEVADFIGDSLELAKKAAETSAEIIVFAGVHFMAETAKILNPSKRVFLPDLNAGCSLADSCPPEAFRKLKEQYPDHVVVTYINCSAEIKTHSDVVCTSSNAEKVINSIPPEKQIIFAPDKNLGKYLMQKTGREMLLWDGACIVHEAFSLDKMLELYKQHPSAKIIAHPESETHILKIANYIGSTSGMLNYVKGSEHDTFIVATEAGILHQMQNDVPQKTLIPAPAKEDNTCACSECAFMKMNTLKKLYDCLAKETPEIKLSEDLMKKALVPIKRMLQLS